MLIREGEWTLYSSDIKRGKYTWRRVNEDGSSTFRTDTICDPIIDANTAQRNITSPGWGGDWHHIASIPNAVVWDQLMDASLQDDQKYISKWLNDSDNAAWRTKEGNV